MPLVKASINGRGTVIYLLSNVTTGCVVSVQYVCLHTLLMLASSHRHIQVYNSGINGVRESSTRCNFRTHMQIEKSPADQENIFISLTAGGANAHNQIHFICSALFFFFGCFVSICSMCVVKLMKVVFLICRCFFVFAAR